MLRTFPVFLLRLIGLHCSVQQLAAEDACLKPGRLYLALTAMLLFHCTGLLVTFVLYQCCQFVQCCASAKALLFPADCGHASLPVKRKFLLLGCCSVLIRRQPELR